MKILLGICKFRRGTLFFAQSIDEFVGSASIMIKDRAWTYLRIKVCLQLFYCCRQWATKKAKPHLWDIH